MAAAALLRSMARKLARAAAAPPPPRPLLAAGLHVGAIAGLRSGAALPSLATKIARAPSQPHHRHILNRRLHSGSTPAPTTDKDKIIEDLRLQLRQSRAAAGLCSVILSGLLIYGQFWVLPRLKKMRDRSVAFERLERHLRDIKADEDEPRSVALAQILQAAGHMNQQRNGTTEKGTGVAKLEEELIAVCSDILEEIGADLKELRAASMSNSAPLEQKEGCSRVGSETVSS